MEEASLDHRALILLESAPRHLLPLDPHMPRIDGRELMLRAREMQSDHPPHRASRDRQRYHCSEGSAADCLLEAFSTDDLCAAISQALQERTEEASRQQLPELIEGTQRTPRQADIPATVDPPPTAIASELLAHAGPIALYREKRLAVVDDFPHRVLELTEGRPPS